VQDAAQKYQFVVVVDIRLQALSLDSRTGADCAVTVD
jgi:hypothetical protein